MNSIRKSVLAGLIAGSVVLGGVIGTTAFGAGSTATQTTTGTLTTPAAPAAPSGAFKPIETPSHESTESTQREAQEDAGQVPTVP